MTSGKFATTLGYERRFSPAFLYDDRDDFIAFMTHGQPSRPANVENIVLINQGRKPLAGALPVVSPLTPERVREMIGGGQLLLDAREYRQYGAFHIPGSLTVQLSSPQFEQRIGWISPVETSIILLLASDDQLIDALKKLAFIGLENRVAGYLAGGIEAWQRAGYETTSLPQVRAGKLQEQLESGELAVLDVREADEWQAGHIEGARHMSLRVLDSRYEELGLDPAAPLAIVCAGGFRSTTAASILRRRGFRAISNLIGGMGAWERVGLPTVQN